MVECAIKLKSHRILCYTTGINHCCHRNTKLSMNFYITYFKWKCTAGSPEDDSSLACWIVKLNVKHNIVEVEVVVLLTYCKVLGNHTIVALKSLLLCWHNLQYAVVILSVWLKVCR